MILLLVEGVLEQEQPEAMMIRLLLFLLLFCGPALTHDDGRYANSPLKEWFNRLASGKGLCCSFADGYVLGSVITASSGTSTHSFSIRT